MIIIENKAQCLRCRDVIESKHVHDFVSCTCGNLAIDGGREHLSFQIGGGDETWLPLWMTEPDWKPKP